MSGHRLHQGGPNGQGQAQKVQHTRPDMTILCNLFNSFPKVTMQMMTKRLIPIQTPINLGYFSQILARPRASMKMQSPIMRYFAHFGQTKLNFHKVN